MFDKIKSKIMKWAVKTVFYNLGSIDEAEDNKFKDTFSFLQAPQQITWVSVCCDAIARAVKKQEWKIFDYKNNEEVSENNSTLKELKAFLNSPTPSNDVQKGFKNVIELWVWRLLLTGKQPILRYEYNSNTLKTKAIYLLRPDCISPKIGTDSTNYGKLVGWEYRVDEKTINYEPNQIILSALPHPYKRFEGLGMIERNITLYNTEQLAQKFNYMFFKNNAIQDSAITIPDTLTEDNEKRLRQSIENMKGVKNAHKFHLFMGGMDIKSIGVKHSDMQFELLRKMNREEILALFNVPPAVVGVFEYANYANSKEQENFFQANAVQPMLDRIADTITRELVNYYNPDWYFEFDEVDTKNQKEWADVAVILKNAGIITPNEARTLYIGLGEIKDNEGMNKPYQPMNAIEIGSTYTEEETEEAPIKAVISTKSKYTSNQLRQAIIKIANLNKQKIGKKTKDDMREFFDKQKKRVMERLETYKSYPKNFNWAGVKENLLLNTKALFNEMQEDRELKKALKRSHVAITLKAVDEMNDLFEGDIEASLDNPALARSVYKLQNLSTKINDTTMKDIQDSIQEGIANEESFESLVERVENVYKKADGYRAEMIAKTEAFRAWDAGTIESYKELGVKVVDVVGCECSEYPCNATDIPIDEADELEFHPNHTGVIVPRV